MSNDRIIEELARDILALKQEVERISKLTPLYEIKNNKLYADLTADQNNFALDNYDFIKLNPTANRTIHGITNGTMGRMLFLRNLSNSFTISFTHQNAAATVGNRIVTGSSGTIVLGVRQTAIFLYDSDPVLTGTNLWFLLIPGA